MLQQKYKLPAEMATPPTITIALPALSENKKYRFDTSDTIEKDEQTLYRIICANDFGLIKAGDKGGYIASEKNLSTDGTAWVYDDATVCGDAQVTGDARVYGNAEISDHACISGNAWVSEEATVSCYTRVCDNARVYGQARVSGYAFLCDGAQICEEAWLTGDSWVHGNAIVSGEAHVSDSADIFDNARVCGKIEVYGQAIVRGHALVCEEGHLLVLQNVGPCGGALSVARDKNGKRFYATEEFYGNEEAFAVAIERITTAGSRERLQYTYALNMAAACLNCEPYPKTQLQALKANREALAS